MALGGSLGTGSGGKWEVDGTALQPLASAGATEILLATAADQFTATGDDATGDFENAGSNISHDGTSWDNDFSTDTGTDITDTVGSAFSGTTTGHELAFDNNSSWPANSWYQAIETGDQEQIWDMGSAKVIGGVTWELSNAGVYGISAVTVQGCDTSGGTYVTLGSGTPGAGDPTTGTATWVNTTGYRYIKIQYTNTGSNSFNVYEMKLHESAPVSTDNTVDADMPFTGTKNFAPGSIVVKDEGGTEIEGTGVINVDYNINAAGFIGSLLDLQTFKVLAASLFASATSLKIQIQPVGTQKFSDVLMSTTSSAVRVKNSGEVQVEVNGVITDKLNSSRTPSATDVTSSAERFIAITNTGSARTVTLATADVIDGIHITINDESGAAGTNNITIATEGSETIDGASTATISSNYGSVSVYCNGTNWFTY